MKKCISRIFIVLSVFMLFSCVSSPVDQGVFPYGNIEENLVKVTFESYVQVMEIDSVKIKYWEIFKTKKKWTHPAWVSGFQFVRMSPGVHTFTLRFNSVDRQWWPLSYVVNLEVGKDYRVYTDYKEGNRYGNIFIVDAEIGESACIESNANTN